MQKKMAEQFIPRQTIAFCYLTHQLLFFPPPWFTSSTLKIRTFVAEKTTMNKHFYFIKKISTVLMLLCAFTVAMGQDIATEIQNINAIFQGHASMELKLTYNFFNSHTATEPHEITQSVIKFQDDNYYSKVGPFESFKNREYEFRINHDEKAMMVLPPSPNISNHSLTGFDTLAIAMLKSCEHQTITNLSKNESKIVIGCSFTEYESFEIYYNPNTYKTLKYIVYFRHLTSEEGNKIRLEILFDKLSKGLSIPAQAFSPAPYIKQTQSGKFIPQSAYSHYQFQDHRQ